MNFFLKRFQNYEEKQAGKPGSRVIECLRLRDGEEVRCVDKSVDGHGECNVRQSLPIAYAKFSSALKDFGLEKARKLCLENGEFEPNPELRPLPVISRDLERAESLVLGLKDEQKKALESARESEKSVKKEEKPKPRPKKSEVKKEEK